MAHDTSARTTQSPDSVNADPTSDECADLRRALDESIRSAKELRQSAERARRQNDRELSAFFERCAVSDEARITEAKELLSARTELPAGEAPTTAAFAAGDGADDADVSPNSQRGKVGIWPAM